MIDPEAARLEDELLDWMGSAPAGFIGDGTTRAERYGVSACAAADLDARFEALALGLFAFQYERVPVYRGYCDLLERTPATVRCASEVPALPVDAFRRTRVATFPPASERARFQTSGTTGASTGILHLDGFALYHTALERSFQHHVIPDTDSIRMLVLVAAPDEAPHSSLGHMFDRVRRKWGSTGSATLHRGGAIRWRELRAALEEACAARQPVCLLGTAFGWVQVLEACASEKVRFDLPPGSRLLETGGYKGRTRELSPADLRTEIERRLGIPSSHVVSEYGMTEMGSQLYTLNLRRVLLGEPVGDSTWSYPAWLRPRLVDAETGRASDLNPPAGTQSRPRFGLIAQHDLANRASVAHLLTADLGRAVGPSFQLQGRCPDAEPRGCGLVHEPAAART